MMKQLTGRMSGMVSSLAMVLLLGLGPVICASFGSVAFAADKPFKVVTTFTILADMARNVAGDKAIVESITKPGAEIHNYQPTPRDMIRGQGADLILWNGLNLELWFKRFFSNLSGVDSVVLSEGVEPISIRKGPYKGKPNPHAWMSPGGRAYLCGEYPQGAGCP